MRPTNPSRAGSRVRAADAATNTAIMAEKPMDRNAARFTSCVPDNATTTVRPETNTALPLVAMASATASGGSIPFRSPSR